MDYEQTEQNINEEPVQANRPVSPFEDSPYIMNHAESVEQSPAPK